MDDGAPATPETASHPAPVYWDRETDLLVAGAGPAGMTAALVASLEGIDVILCEKAEQVGGTGATSAGTLWIPGNRQSAAAGFADSADDAARYLDGLLAGGPAGAAGAEMRALYLRDGPDVIDYLMEKTDVQFVPCGKHPDYRNNMPGAAVDGRAIIPANFDGRRLGRDFARVKPPIDEFMLMGGMMVGKLDIMNLIDRWRRPRAFLHSAKIVARYWLDRLRYRRGTRLVMGNALVARLFYSLKKRGVPVMFGAPVQELVFEGGAVAGAILGTAEGPVRVRARKGVVFATGGFAHNRRYRTNFMPKPTPPCSLAAETNEGDGLRIAEGAGAGIASAGHQASAFWTPVSVTYRADGTKGLFPHLSLDRAKPGLIAVNSAGRRFVNEAVSYHDFVEAMYRSNETVNTMPAWLICDSAFVQKYGIGIIHPGTRDLSAYAKTGYATVADSLEALAAKLKIKADAFADTVARHNRFAEEGSDPDFGKGDLELNRFNGDPAHGPNPCLGPIATPPFVAVAVWPAEIGCSIGLDTTPDGEVKNAAGEIIPGLYACGNDMSSVMAGSYPGPGTTLGPAMVFGWRVAMRAAGKARDL
jgi:succinate dehydrogenase/fumarate reductase flavoprotein subunit